MKDVDRRSALALGLTAAAAAPLLPFANFAMAKEYGPNEGKELWPGVRLVEVGEVPSEIAAYKMVKVVDIVFQPKAAQPKEEVMDMDMVCYIAAGEFDVTKRGQTFKVKQGDIYTCGKGKTDRAANTSNVVGIHRISLLVPA
jgi:quercetin dioxygenase-like cupin family protein